VKAVVNVDVRNYRLSPQTSTCKLENRLLAS